MSRAVFLNVSGGGHVIATYGLVAELVRRGEEVVYVEVPPYQPDIESLGARFVCYPPIRPFEGPLSGLTFHHELDLAPILTWCALEWIPQILGTIRDLEPDYIVHDSICLWGKVIARLLGVPAFCSVATPAFNWPIALATGRFWRDAPELLLRGRKTLAAFRETERLLRRTYGLPRTSLMDVFTNREPVNLCHTPRELQPHDSLLDDTYHFLGSVHPLPAHRTSAFPMEQLCDPVIYIAFGTVCDPGPQFFRNCVTAFRDLDAQVVMLLPASTTRDDLGEVPANFLVWSVSQQGFVPQLDILAHANLFVMNGGMGSARESAWHGVPMLTVPTTFETYTISQRIEEQGAGLSLPPDASAGRLREAAQAVLRDPSYRANSARIGAACRAAGGAKRGADVIMQSITPS